MSWRPVALLLHSREEPLNRLGLALRKQRVETIRARSYAEALRALSREDAPTVIFTDLTTSDGLWGEVLCLARTSAVPVNLIVVSDVPDLALWRSAIECGAFGFITRPLLEDELYALVQRAAEDVARRRPANLRLAKTA
jgi:DNA-binding NtrC family response regulator